MTSLKLISLLHILITIQADHFVPYGFQSGHFTNPSENEPTSSDSESINDDSFAGGMYYDAQRNLIYFTGVTYGMYFDGAKQGDSERMQPHLANGDCFLGVLKLPVEEGPNLKDDPSWLIHNGMGGDSGANLIYARRLGTPQNSEACSSISMLTQVEDSLVNQSGNKLKLALLGHVNPTPLSSADLNSRLLTEDTMVQQLNVDYEFISKNGTSIDTNRQLYDKNKGGFFSSLSKSDPITEKGRAYGFIADIDIELHLNNGGDSISGESHFDTANTALLGGYVLESSPLVYPVAMTQSRRDPDQIYVVSMHSDDEDAVNEGMLNPEYKATIQMESDATLRARPDLTLGGAGGNGADLVGGVPKYGEGFYVKVQQLTITPYEQLMNVEPTESEKIKTTMKSGWGFGFKLNDAKDVRPSCVEFVKGRDPDEDLILLAGTTRKEGANGYTELDGFVTKLIPPAPSPVPDYTTGTNVDNASEVQTEAKNPTKRIDSTTGRDETVTAICLPPPNPKTGVISHAFIVGSIANSESETNPTGKDPSLAYLLMMKLDDMSTVWKQRIPSIHPNGIGGDVLGEGCAVSPDGKIVYLAGTVDGGSALNTGSPNNLSNPSDPNSPPVKPVGGVSDIFVVAYDVMFGNVMWAKQVGTVHEDKLARGGGVAVDNEGNVIIMGSTRGPLQRYRSIGSNRELQEEQRLASDIFVMSLSKESGNYINAPYIGSSSSPTNSANKSASLVAAAAAGVSHGGIAGIAIVSVFFTCALGLCICRRVRSKRGKNAERMWDREYGDDFTFDGYRERSIGGRKSSVSDGLRIVRGGQDDEWDDGSERIRNSASWMRNNEKRGMFSANQFKSSKSVGHKSTYTRRKSFENGNFLASLRDEREEANMTLSKMANESDATDPRLDDGASIKSLLSQYRESRKGKLFQSDKDDPRAKDSNVASRNTKMDFRSNPPPPPPRREEENRRSIGGDSAEGLAEFTIV